MVLVVGVNGTGKTTTVGKLARVLVAEDRDVVLGAADTFRAAAADQLQTWGTGWVCPRSVRPDGADPASVAFDAVRAGRAEGSTSCSIDTAGRLQNKAGLMDELGKITRVIERRRRSTEVLLVLDATTGQNGLTQARVFREVVGVTGIVLTKLDGTAKGGIVVASSASSACPSSSSASGKARTTPGAVRPRGVRRRPARLTVVEGLARRCTSSRRAQHERRRPVGDTVRRAVGNLDRRRHSTC